MATEDKTMDYRSTLNLPKTSFPMRGSLAKREPERLKAWEDSNLRQRILEHRKGAPKWVMHDGPPYANGEIHLGTALNKVLKDIAVRYKTMTGHYVKYVPGFDCHGLPIEQKALEELGLEKASKSPLELRRVCREYATKFIGVMSEQFKRLGVGGVWEEPYLTLDPKVEYRAMGLFRDLVKSGYVYKGFKPVSWDTVYQTALAEAEIEHEEHVSPSIYVRFPCLNPEDNAVLASLGKVNFVIWTTTPWTLPANLAVCLHPDLDYVVAEVNGGERVVAAESLLNAFCEDAGLGSPKVLARCKGKELEGLRCSHPLMDKEPPVILGQHVTLEQGTGCVHTAPGHGAEDFEVCQKYGIEVFQPVDGAGNYTELYPDMQGVNVWDANPRVIESLDSRGLLVSQGKITHQYPYSWRSHKPLIVRATEQWFLNMDHNGLRQACLKAIDEDVEWIPGWGRERIRGMVADRPDWCLSRQRSWGMPIPSLYSVKAKKSILAPEVIDKFLEHVERDGTDCWFSLPVEEFLPEGFVCPESGGTEFEKEYDILDVWFDSGCTHASVVDADPDLHWPADLYLEGSDQHRGWFNSSLTTSVAWRGKAPYKEVLTHGFVLDKKGTAMSKSKGNVISPLDVVDRIGADVLRLWVSSQDYRADMRAGDEIFSRVSEAYRKIRNTLRYLLGNTADFDPSKAVEPESLEEIDRWALAKLDQLVETAEAAYERYEFHRVYRGVHEFCVEMSAAYLDVVKDRLYCSGPEDVPRRAAQTVMAEYLSKLTRLLAPILPFTADEAWEAAHGQGQCVHLADFPESQGRAGDSAMLERFSLLAEVQQIAGRKLEQAREEKRIGSALDAKVVVRVRPAELLERLREDQDLLGRVFGVSQCQIEPHPEAGPGDSLDERIDVEVIQADGRKCERCWNWRVEVGQSQDHPGLCGRCVEVMTRLPLSAD